MDLKEEAEFKAFLKEFGYRVEKLIYEKFGSKGQFITETGFYKKSLHDILTGSRDMHLSKVYQLAKTLKIPLKKLFEGLD